MRPIGVRASLNFHEFVSNPKPLGFTVVWGNPLTPLRPLSGVIPTHLLPVGVRKRWGNPPILRYLNVGGLPYVLASYKSYDEII